MTAFVHRCPCFALLLLIIGSAGSQTSLFERQQTRLCAPAASFQYWTIEEDAVHQIALPVLITVPVNEKLQMNLSTSPAFSGYSAHSTVSLSGLSDARLSGSYLFNQDKFLATFGVSLPSGKHALTSEEFLVANLLALHAFDFDVPILGQGLDATVGLVTAHRLADMVVGVGAGYLLRGAFEPIKNATAQYNPGDEINFSLAVDKPVGRKNKFMVDANYTIYGSDTVSGQDVFQAGNRVTVQAMLLLAKERLSWLFSVRDRIRGKNKTGSGALIPERQNSNGNELEVRQNSNSNELEVSATVFLPLNSYAKLHGQVEGRLYSNNAYDIGGAQVLGVGGGYNRQLSAHLFFTSDLRFYFGSLDYGDNLSVKGLRGLMGLKITL
jgi:hypothetical protein